MEDLKGVGLYFLGDIRMRTCFNVILDTLYNASYKKLKGMDIRLNKLTVS